MSAAPVRPSSASQMPTEITLDDLRHKALAIRDTATDEARRLAKANTTRIVIASAVVCAVALSMAYYMGTRAARRARGRA
jgi:hypothetical protein